MFFKSSLPSCWTEHTCKYITKMLIHSHIALKYNIAFRYDSRKRKQGSRTVCCLPFIEYVWFPSPWDAKQFFSNLFIFLKKKTLPLTKSDKNIFPVKFPHFIRWIFWNRFSVWSRFVSLNSSVLKISEQNIHFYEYFILTSKLSFFLLSDRDFSEKGLQRWKCLCLRAPKM